MKRLDRYDNCRRHSITTNLTDALQLSQTTPKAERSHFFGSHHTFEVLVFFLVIHPLKHIPGAIVVRAFHKGELLRQRLDTSQYNTDRLVPGPNHFGKHSTHVGVTKLFQITMNSFCISVLGSASPQSPRFELLACHLGTEMIVASAKPYRKQPKQSSIGRKSCQRAQ